MSRRVVIALALAGVLLVATVVVGTAGSGGHDALPEGGSSFGAGPPRAGDRVHLLDALAPVLGGGRVVARGATASDRRRVRARRRPGLGLPVAEAAAQLFLVGFQGKQPGAPFFDRLRVRAWGGVVLERVNYDDPAQLAALAGEVEVVARNAGRGAPIVAALQHGGSGTAFPNLPPASQDRAPAPAAARQEALLAGQQLSALGVRMTLAPVADLGTVGGPHERRAYSDQPAAVTRAVRAAVDGYRAAKVVGVPGHFPGEGSASQDPSAGAATVGLSLEELRRQEVKPFAAVARRAAAIQLSNALYAGFDGVTPATLLPQAVNELRRIGFRGVVVSGDLAAVTLATGGSVAHAAVDALRAGCDLLWLPGDERDQEQAWRAVVRAIRSGEIGPRRITAALRRIDALKKAYGIQ